MNIINSHVYNEKITLKQTINHLADKKNDITDEMLINLISKYFFAYFYNESVDQKVYLSQINEKFDWGSRYCKVLKEIINWDMLIADISKEQSDFYTKFLHSNYGVAMLGDIASTVKIVKDIITRTIPSEFFDKKYIGLDLWTGSWILLLAQYIQALRNDFHSIKNMGIEIDQYTVPHTSNLIEKLWAGKVFQWDTTDEKLYNTLNIQSNITFISNENIPTGWIAMNWINDPFHQNNKALYLGPIRNRLSPDTQTFPKEIKMSIQKDWGIIKELIGSHSNWFIIESLTSLEKDIKAEYWAQLPPNRTILDYVFVEGILLDETMIPMEKIGNDLLRDGKVGYNTDWSYRWLR